MFNNIKNIICFPSIYWSHNWERHQEIIYRFSLFFSQKNIKIVQPLGMITPSIHNIFYKIKTKLKERKKNDESYTNMINENMDFVNLNFIPIYHNELIDKINSYNMRCKIDVKDSLVWATYVNSFMFESFVNAPYKILDLATRRQVNEKLTNSVKSLEIEAVKEADVVFVDNINTFKDYKDYAKRIEYIPQGVNLKDFPKEAKLEEYHYLKQNSESKIIGYCGALHEYIDYDLFEKLIKTFSNHIFMIVGNTIDDRAKKLFNYSNVVEIGRVAHSELVKYYNFFDIGLIPYSIEPFTTGVFPTKFFEYLATDCVVLSCELPDLVQYEDKTFVSIYRNEEEAMQLLKNLINEKERINKKEMREFVKKHTWEIRFKAMIKSIGETL